MSTEREALEAQLQDCLSAAQIQREVPQRERLMMAYLALSECPEVSSIDKLKHLFAAQDLARELYEETNDARYQDIVKACKARSSQVMTHTAQRRLPGFVLKFLRKKKA